MSTTPFSGPYPMGIPQALAEHLTAGAISRRAKSRTHVIRRQPTEQQGKALLSLGHAIEYLIDSRMHSGEARLAGAEAKSDAEASQILMRLNRAVFAECREIVPVRLILQRWLGSLFAANW
jgi:3-dehydroquinate synthetase